MRGVGDPRSISILARLPERGLRGCRVLAPNVFHKRSSYSGAGRGGVGRGIGTAHENDGGSLGRGRGAGRGFPPVEIDEEQQRNGYSNEVASGRFSESRDGDPTRIRGPMQIRVGALQQQGGVAAGRGRGIPFTPHQQQVAVREDASVSSVAAEQLGRGRSIPESQPPRPARAGSVGRDFPLEGNVDVPKQDVGSSGGGVSQEREHLSQVASHQGSTNSDPLPSTDKPKLSAVEQLLAKLGRSAPMASPPLQSSAPAEKPKLPFRMPFARGPPAPAKRQPETAPPKPAFQAQAQAPVPFPPLPPLGRGRGQPGAAPHPEIGAEPEAAQKPKRDDRMPERARPGAPRPPSPPRMQLSVEEARARAIAILEKGIEKNVAAEGERRRIASMEKFADATEFLTDRFKRAPGQSLSSQPQRTRDERQRPSAVSRRSDRQRRQRPSEEAVAVAESAEELTLTPEQEAKLVRIQEEDTFKDRLHTLFLTQFEPEFAMEEFGRNPDIHEPPVLSLEEYLQSQKSLYLPVDAELSMEQKWQEAVKTSLANAPNLGKLVEAYAGPGRMTARQQIAKLQTIHQKLPLHVAPEVAAFTQRAFLTLQNNPSLRMHQKEKLMTNIVSGFSSS